MIHTRRIIFLLVAIIAITTSVQAYKKRHPSLDPLTSSDQHLSAAGKDAHSRVFHDRLVNYAGHLGASADAMLIQLEHFARHESENENQDQIDAGADMDETEAGEQESEAEMEQEVEAEAADQSSVGAELDALTDVEVVDAANVNFEAALTKFFNSGDSLAVAHILELKHGVTLSNQQRAILASEVEGTMRVVAAGVDNGEAVDKSLLRDALEAMVAQIIHPTADIRSLVEQTAEHGSGAVMWNVDAPPDWVKDVLQHAHNRLGNEESTIYHDLVSAAKAHARTTDERVLRYTQPFEKTMESVLQGAFAKIQDKNSTLGKELRYIAQDFVKKTDPDAQPGPDWLQKIVAEEIRALDDPNRGITKNLISTAKQVQLQTDPTLDPGPAWVQSILAGAIVDVEQGTGDIQKQLVDAAETHNILHPEAQSTADLAHEIFTHLNETELEARLRFQARKQVFEDLVDKQKAKCARVRRRGQKCNLNQFITNVGKGLESILKNEVPRTLSRKKDEPLSAKSQLDIARGPTSTPESVRDVELAIKGGVDPWGDLPGRQVQALFTKDRYVIDLLDPLAERCPKKCSLHGQCIMDMNSTVKSPSGVQNVHPFHCLCDQGYVGDACQIKLDMHLRWLLTEGAAPFPKCCKVCEAQREVPLKWDDIPAYNNPFSQFAPECQPFPRISQYSREDGSHELIKGRRPDPKCSHPLGEITRADPIVALQLAEDIAQAQQVLTPSFLEEMAFISSSAENLGKMDAEAKARHKHKLQHGVRVLKAAADTAKKAAAALALKLHITDLSKVKYSSIDLDQLLEDYRELPNDMEECCLFCQLDPEPLNFMSNSNPAANVGPNAILNQDPRKDNTVDAQHRRLAQKRAEKRYAKLTGTVPKSDQECCVVCPYNFRELERLEEAAWIRKHTGGNSDEEEKNRVFLEVFAEVEGDRRRRHEPRPCCAACPSQFLIAHAFPAGPWTTTRTLPNTGPQ